MRVKVAHVRLCASRALDIGTELGIGGGITPTSYVALGRHKLGQLYGLDHRRSPWVTSLAQLRRLASPDASFPLVDDALGDGRFRR